ncbi:hypothetical protein, partial [Vibrio fluvialis]|uniref:hypothetical protein n=1 Tax=Vibrio fluvialis TaxID=676 RepID=UPI001EECD194
MVRPFCGLKGSVDQNKHSEDVQNKCLAIIKWHISEAHDHIQHDDRTDHAFYSLVSVSGQKEG